jgi:hypothetical protein
MTSSPWRVTSVLVAALVAAYAPFLGGGFLTDDFVHLARLESAASVREIFTQPDAFGMFRPLTQASLAFDAAMFGDNAIGYRVVNLALHAAVLALAFVVARMVLLSGAAAAAATIAYALTPKAHPIAVLWISARSELLMALLSLACVVSWIKWTRAGGSGWVVASACCYVLAVLSKETSILLPALLLLSPGSSRLFGARLQAVTMFSTLAVVLLWWRANAGALMPVSEDPHYNLAVPPFRFVRNVCNYIGRMVPVPLVLVVVAGLAASLSLRRSDDTVRGSRSAAVFAAAWIVVFLAPVLGIVARSELYLYLPTFGCCLLAAWIVSPWLDRLASLRRGIPIFAVTVIALAGYHVSRSAALHDDLVFSERLVRALSQVSSRPDRAAGQLVLVPADAYTNQYLQDAIGGYIHVVARFANVPAGALRLRCTYAHGRVILESF